MGSVLCVTTCLYQSRNDLFFFCFLQEAETKAKNMEREICKLQKTLEDRNCQLEASTSAATKVLTFYIPFWLFELYNNIKRSKFDIINLKKVWVFEKCC